MKTLYSLPPRNAAFTLIELLFVVVIITTLASIVVPAIFKSSEQSKVAAAQITVLNVQKRIDAYCELNGSWPDTIDPQWFVSKQHPRSPYSPDYSRSPYYYPRNLSRITQVCASS